jgi:putative membrane protein insertion efficiency factor
LVVVSIAWMVIALLVSSGHATSETVVLAAIHGYQQRLSPIAARAGFRCRFTPTCSRYAEVVIARDGVIRGGIKAIGRIARCGPWTAIGTRDDP